LLTGVISYVAGDGVTLVSSADETAKDVYRVLHDGRLAHAERSPEPRHRFQSTGDPTPFGVLGRRFLGPEIDLVESAIVGVPSTAR
jgi:glutamate racemase